MCLSKDIFKELLQTAGIPAQYFCRSFTTWDVLLPTREQVAKLAESCTTIKFFRLQPEYTGKRRIRVTLCNVPENLPGEVMASFLSSCRRVEKVTQLRAAAGTAHGDYVFRLCLIQQGFQNILEYHLSQRQVNDAGGKGQVAALLEQQTTRPPSESLLSEGLLKKNNKTQVKTSFQPPKKNKRPAQPRKSMASNTQKKKRKYLSKQ